jgi:hypothetical protein
MAGIGALFGGLKGARIAIASVLGLVVLVGIGFGVWVLWEQHQERVRDAQEKAREAETSQWLARIDACNKRFSPNNDVKFERCTENPDSVPCWTAPDKNGGQLDMNSFRDLKGNLVPPKPDQICYPGVGPIPSVSQVLAAANRNEQEDIARRAKIIACVEAFKKVNNPAFSVCVENPDVRPIPLGATTGQVGPR